MPWGLIGVAMLIAGAFLALLLAGVAAVHIVWRWWLMLAAGLDWDDAGTLIRMKQRRVHEVHRVTDQADFRVVRQVPPAHSDDHTMLIDLPVLDPPLRGGLELGHLQMVSGKAAEPYCPRCDHDAHYCPGCGSSVPHGSTICTGCSSQHGHDGAEAPTIQFRRI